MEMLIAGFTAGIVAAAFFTLLGSIVSDTARERKPRRRKDKTPRDFEEERELLEIMNYTGEVKNDD